MADTDDTATPSVDDFPLYDEVDSEQGELELPADSFDPTKADFDSEACGCVR